MTVKIDIDFNPLISGMNKIIKASESFKHKTKATETSIKSYEKEMYKASKAVFQFGKTLGMTRTQMNQILHSIHSVGQANIQSKKSYDKLVDVNKNLQKELNSVNKKYDKQREKLEDVRKAVTTNSKEIEKNTYKNRLNTLTLADWIKHAQRLIRYYALVRLAMLAYGEAISTITKGSEFEHSLLTLSGVLRKTLKEVKPLETEILRLGSSTEWTATQISDAARYLAMAGLNMKQVSIALKSTLDLATAGNIDLARAADISTNILSAFGLEVKQLSNVNDILIATITRTNSTIEELAEALKYAAPIAKSFGYEIEEVASFLGLLHNAGIKGSMAGTNLARAMFQTSKVFRNLKADTISLADRIGEGRAGLTRALEGMRKEMWGSDKVIKVMGDRAAKAALIFLDLEKRIESLKLEIKDSGNESERLAQIMRSSLINEFNMLNSVIEDIKIEIFYNNLINMKELLAEIRETLSENREQFLNIGKVLNGLTISLKFIIKNFNTFLNVIGTITMALIVLSTKGTVVTSVVGGFLLIKKVIESIIVSFYTLKLSVISFGVQSTITSGLVGGLTVAFNALKLAIITSGQVLKAHPIFFISAAALLIVANINSIIETFDLLGEKVVGVINNIKEKMNEFLEYSGREFRFEIIADFNAKDSLNEIESKKLETNLFGDIGKLDKEGQLNELMKKLKEMKAIKALIIGDWEFASALGIDDIAAELGVLRDLQKHGVDLTIGQIKRLNELKKAEREFYIDMGVFDKNYYDAKLKLLNKEIEDYYESNLTEEQIRKLSLKKRLEFEKDMYGQRFKLRQEYYDWTGDENELENAGSNKFKELETLQRQLVESGALTENQAEKLIQLKKDQYVIDQFASQETRIESLLQLKRQKELKEFGKWEKTHWDLKNSMLEHEILLQLSLTENYKKQQEILNKADVEKQKLIDEEREANLEKNRYLSIEFDNRRKINNIQKEINVINNDFFKNSTRKYDDILEKTRERINLEKEMANTVTEKIKIETEGQLEIYNIEQERADLQRQTLAELKQGLYLAALELGRMIAEGEDLNKALRETARTVGSIAGQAIGSYYGGPAGGAAGGVIGGVVGGVIGDTFFPDSSSQEQVDVTEELNKSTQELIQSILDLNDSIRDSEMSNTEIITQVGSSFEEIINAQSEIDRLQEEIIAKREELEEARRRRDRIEEEDRRNRDRENIDRTDKTEETTGDTTSGDTTGTVTEALATLEEAESSVSDIIAALEILEQSEEDYTTIINDLMTEITPLIQSLSQLAAAARQTVQSMIDIREADRVEAERSGYSSLEWESLLGSLGQTAINWRDQILTPEQLSAIGSEDSDEYLLAKAQSDYAQIMYAEALQQLDEAERQFVEAMEESANETITALNEQIKLAEEQLNMLDGLARSIRELKDGLLASELNPDQSFAYAQSRYNELRAIATATDEESNLTASEEDYDRYLNYVNTYLERAKEFYKNSGEYETIFNQVMTDLDGLESDIQTDIDLLTEEIATFNSDITTAIDNLSTTIGEIEFPSFEDVTGTGGTASVAKTALAALTKGTDTWWNQVRSIQREHHFGFAELVATNMRLRSGWTIEEIFDDLIGVGQWAEGGVSQGPESGYPAMLHGTEAIIPLKNGSVPVTMNSNNKRIEELLELLLINASEGSKVEVSIDGGQLDGRIERIADNNRVRAVQQNLGKRNLIL